MCVCVTHTREYAGAHTRVHEFRGLRNMSNVFTYRSPPYYLEAVPLSEPEARPFG